MARPVGAAADASYPVLPRLEALSRRAALIDLLWVGLPLLVHVELIEPIFIFGVLRQSTERPIPYFALLGAILVRCAMVAALIGWRLHRRRQPASSIGWTARNGLIEFLLGVPAAAALLILVVALALWLLTLWPQAVFTVAETQQAALQRFPSMDLASRVILAVVVALAEELFFRGLLLHRLVVICRGALPAVLAQAALFSLAHVYEGPFACLVIAYLGLALGALTCWRRTLLPAIVAHALFNIAQFTLLHTLVRPAP